VKVLICYKWERDSGEATISHDGSLKWFNTKLKPSDDDAAAIACARQIAADTSGDLTAVTIGDGDAAWALARGASRTVCVSAYTPSKDDAVTAAQLAKSIKAAGEFDVVLMGDAQEFAGVVPITAALLGLPLVAGVSDVAIDPGSPDCLIAHRTTAEAQETLKIRVPALVSVAASGSEKAIPSMKQILAAKKLPIDELDAAEMGTVAETRMVVKEIRVPARREVQMFEGDVPQAVGELIAALRADKLL